MKLLASDRKLTEMTVNDGPVIKRQKDAAFHVDDAMGRSLVRSGEWGVVGTTFRNAQGFECQDCHRVNVFRERCGKCGGTNLKPED
jgi:hypothetical protein